MIIIQLNGGLGNQLFQYATGRAVSLRLNIPLKFDISSYKNESLREYRLKYFNVKGDVASRNDLSRYKGSLILRYLRNKARMFYPFKTEDYMFKQESNSFNPDILKLQRGCYLSGYWQSEKYFKDFDDIIRKDLVVVNEPDDENATVMKKIEKSNSVCIHIRRGDYVKNSNILNLNIEYYNTAISLIKQQISNPFFFIFSDEIEWVKNNLTVDDPHYYISHNGPVKDYEDLRLMSHCENFIIANSSFSWWGAWLSGNKNKIVIAPKKWGYYTERGLPPKRDMIPESWVSIQNSYQKYEP